jgi:hypothetical protein
LPTRNVAGTIYGTSKVTLTTELPIPAQTAAALARKPELMKYVLGPVPRVYRMDVLDRVGVGAQGSV